MNHSRSLITLALIGALAGGCVADDPVDGADIDVIEDALTEAAMRAMAAPSATSGDDGWLAAADGPIADAPLAASAHGFAVDPATLRARGEIVVHHGGLRFSAQFDGDGHAELLGPGGAPTGQLLRLGGRLDRSSISAEVSPAAGAIELVAGCDGIRVKRSWLTFSVDTRCTAVVNGEVIGQVALDELAIDLLTLRASGAIVAESSGRVVRLDFAGYDVIITAEGRSATVDLRELALELIVILATL